jgi:HAD superfamily hydrolase (TIGR01490 family)
VGIAFFDLDLTLLSVNSAVLWVRAERRLGRISRVQALRAAAWLVRYRLGMASVDDAIRDAIATLHGAPVDALQRRTADFYLREVRGLFRPGGRLALESHRRAGDRLVLLSSSTSYMAELAARDLGLDDVLCTRLEVDAAGRYTGRPLGTLCYGAGKLTLAAEYARGAQVPWAGCAFYTDSFSDLPVLEAVGRPVVVNPDPRLRRTARQRGWQVVDWGEPRSQAA